MNAEFNWWLLIVGLVVGAGLVWLVVLDSRRREADVDDAERAREAAWLSALLAEEGRDVTPDAADRLLELHRRYLEAPPPDLVPTADPAGPDEPTPIEAPIEPTPIEAPIEPTPIEPTPIAPPPAGSTGATSELADDDRVRLEGGRVDLGQ